MLKYLGLLELTNEEIAREAFVKEIDLGWHGGCQDQYTSVMGGFNLIKGKDNVEVISLPKEQIEGFLPYLCLFDTGIKRKSYNVQKGFKEPDLEQTQALWALKGIVVEARKYFTLGEYENLGRLLHKNWELKKISNNVSNPELDKIYFKGDVFQSYIFN